MVEFVKSADERLADEHARVPLRVEEAEHASRVRIIDAIDNAIHTIEWNLTEEGLKFDAETDEAFAILKHKLSSLKDNA
jgi:hypothetical protein